MSKILIAKEREQVEKIILECKFLGFGSVEIQKQLLSKLGFKTSRPSIDKHYKEHMNGELMSKLIEQNTKLAIKSVQNGDVESELIAPSYCHESAQKVFTYIESREDWNDEYGSNASTDNLKEIYCNAIGLIKGNMSAHLLGKERLKQEYLKYLKELRDMIKVTRYSY